MSRLTLRGYQETDRIRAEREFNYHVLLKHRMGLGKTVLSTRICEDDEEHVHGPVVVICRTHLAIQWIRHYRAEYPGAKIGSLVVETPRGKWRELDRQEKVEMLKDPSYDVRILTFATPRRVKQSASGERASGARTVREIWRDVALEKGWVKGPTKKKQRFEYPLPPCRSLIVDECFTQGALISTPHGPRRIETIQVGDEVWGRNKRGGIVRSRVSKTFVKPTTRTLIQFGGVWATPNHHVWIEHRGYTKLSDILPSDVVLYITQREESDGQTFEVAEVRPVEVRLLWGGNTGTRRQPVEASFLRTESQTPLESRQQSWTQRAYARAHARGDLPAGGSRVSPSTPLLKRQPDFDSNISREGSTGGSREGSLSSKPQRWERSRSDSTSATSRDTLGVVIRAIYLDEGSGGPKEWVSDSVQGGCRRAESKDSSRGGWDKSSQPRSESQRSEEGRMPAIFGLESHTSDERTGSEGSGWSNERNPSTTLIYDLETETSNYFCEGILVHNSSNARGRTSQQYAGIYQLAVPTKQRKAADRVILISTTPAWREQDDLYTQLRLLDPKTFRSYWEFVDQFCLLDESEFGQKVIGGRPKRIAKLLEKYAITRDYSDPDVALAVPEIIPEEVLVGLSPSGTTAYERLENKLAQDRMAGYTPGSGISDFGKITAHDKNKLSALDDVIESLGDEPYALFCKWQDTLELLGRHTGLPIFSGKSGGSRFSRADRIKQSGSFIGTIQSINEGVDLSHLRTMLFYECGYTWGEMDQVRARLKRWRQDGSTDPIRCVYFIVPGSVDEAAYERSMQRGATEEDVMREVQRQARAR